MKKYQRIANTIKERIIKGIFPQQSFLPKQKELAEEFSVSKITPILEIEQIVWTNSGVNIEYSRSRMFTATGLISWSKPAINNQNKIPTEEFSIFSGYFFVYLLNLLFSPIPGSA